MAQVATAGTVLLQVVDAPNRHSVAVTLSETSSGTATVQNYGTAACMHRSCCFVTFGAAPAAAPSPPSRIGSSKKTGADGGGAAAAPRRKPAGPPAAHTIGIPALAAPPPPSSSHLSAVLTGALEPPPPPPPPPLPGVPPAVALRLCSRALPLHSECEEVLRLASAGGLPREAVKRVYHVHSPQLHERYMRGVSFAAASAGQAPPQAAGARSRARTALPEREHCASSTQRNSNAAGRLNLTSLPPSPPPPPAAASASCHCALPAKRTPFERLLFHGSHHSCIANILCHGFDSGHDGGLIWFADQARSRLRLRQGQAGGAQRRLGQAALTAAQSCRALSTVSARLWRDREEERGDGADQQLWR